MTLKLHKIDGERDTYQKLFSFCFVRLFIFYEAQKCVSSKIMGSKCVSSTTVGSTPDIARVDEPWNWQWKEKRDAKRNGPKFNWSD